jgi:hypothetical protein
MRIIKPTTKPPVIVEEVEDGFLTIPETLQKCPEIATLVARQPIDYIFTRDYNATSLPPTCSTAPPYCSYMPVRHSFKKGDIISGIAGCISGYSNKLYHGIQTQGVYVPYGTNWGMLAGQIGLVGDYPIKVLDPEVIPTPVTPEDWHKKYNLEKERNQKVFIAIAIALTIAGIYYFKKK